MGTVEQKPSTMIEKSVSISEPSAKEGVWVKRKCYSTTPPLFKIFVSMMICDKVWSITPTTTAVNSKTFSDKTFENALISERDERLLKHDESKDIFKKFIDKVEHVLQMSIDNGDGTNQVNDFLFYLQESNLVDTEDEQTTRQITEERGQSFTAIVPYDTAFNVWYPTDWGFDPFTVDKFVRHVIKDHIMIGDMKDGAELTTLAGTRNHIRIDGNQLFINHIPIDRVQHLHLQQSSLNSHENYSIVYVDHVFNVNREVIHKWNEQYMRHESAPLVPAPWFDSQFLSHAYKKLRGDTDDYGDMEYEYDSDYPYYTSSDDENVVANFVEARSALNTESFQMMSKIMSMEPNLGELCPDVSTDGGYTLFVPQDESLIHISNELNLTKNHESRISFIKDHIVPTPVYLDDVNNKQIFDTLSHQKIEVIKEKDFIEFDDGLKIVRLMNGGEDEPVYNLGNIIYIDKVLFV